MQEPDRIEKPHRVVVIDFDMKLGSMIIFMVKWVIAAIPAMIILLILAKTLAFILSDIGISTR